LFPSFDDSTRQALYAQTQRAFASATKFEDLFTDGGVLAKAASSRRMRTSTRAPRCCAAWRYDSGSYARSWAPAAERGNIPAVDPNATTRERFRSIERPVVSRLHQYLDPVGLA